MEACDTVTTTIFSAFLKCPTKARFIALGERPPETYFSDIEAGIGSMYKSRAWWMLHDRDELSELATFGQLAKGGTATQWFDCETAVCSIESLRRASADARSRKPATGSLAVPVLFSPWEKPELSDSLLVCFGARLLSLATGICAETGILIYGDGIRRKAVRTAAYASRLDRTIRDMASVFVSGGETPLVLNAHCTTCDFRSKCRGVAVERDDLSLLSGMTPKDRTKAVAKGILTISQLSYGYRPRRRKRTKPDAERAARTLDPAHRRSSARNDNKLKALAIKKGRIHVVGAPSLKLEGVPIFADVEGMPDRDFYYLVGLRFESGGELVERSFWADGPDDEHGMWEEFLFTIKSISDARLVHYGAYETRFLRTMKKRYVTAPDDVDFVDRLIATSVNLVASIYGSVYFPTYSNSLKEVGRYFGFDWAWQQASGASAVLLRKTWELSPRCDIRDTLVTYNMDDCRAAALIADALVRIAAGGPSVPDSVDVGTLEVGFQRTFGKFDSALPEFQKINNAAYWDYQRSKVFVRTDKGVRRTIGRSVSRKKAPAITKEIFVEDKPAKCPKCSAPKFWKYGASVVLHSV